MRLYVIRHAQVRIRPDLPASQWHLAPEGRAATEALAHRLPAGALRAIHHSPEPKAAETARLLAAAVGCGCRVAPALAEARLGGGYLPSAAFEGRVAAYLAGAAGRRTNLTSGHRRAWLGASGTWWRPIQGGTRRSSRMGGS